MKKTIICLANSKKHNGRCLAGIEVKAKHENYILVKNNSNMPKWVRPVSSLGSGQLSLGETQNIKILDVLEIDCLNECPSGAHCENTYYTGLVKKEIPLGRTSENLNALCDSAHDLIFENRGKAVTVEDFNSGCYSLMLIKPENPYFCYGYNESLRVRFSYKNNPYNLPVTDPVFLDKINCGNIDKYNHRDYYFSLSLGTEYLNEHWKLVAGVIEVNK